LTPDGANYRWWHTEVPRRRSMPGTADAALDSQTTLPDELLEFQVRAVTNVAGRCKVGDTVMARLSQEPWNWQKSPRKEPPNSVSPAAGGRHSHGALVARVVARLRHARGARYGHGAAKEPWNRQKSPMKEPYYPRMVRRKSPGTGKRALEKSPLIACRLPQVQFLAGEGHRPACELEEREYCIRQVCSARSPARVCVRARRVSWRSVCVCARAPCELEERDYCRDLR